MKKQNTYNSGFSLIELLVVIALAILLMALIVPATSGLLRSNELTSAGRLIEQTFTNARMLATTRSRRVEVRFIRFNADAQIRGIQVFMFDESGTRATPVSAFRRLPESVTINENNQNSTLWALLTDKNFHPINDPQIPLSGAGTAYTARVVQFLPNGGLALNPEMNWFITAQPNRQNWDTATLPPNFFCVQIDPVLGSVHTYRP